MDTLFGLLIMRAPLHQLLVALPNDIRLRRDINQQLSYVTDFFYEFVTIFCFQGEAGILPAASTTTSTAQVKLVNAGLIKVL